MIDQRNCLLHLISTHATADNQSVANQKLPMFIQLKRFWTVLATVILLSFTKYFLVKEILAQYSIKQVQLRFKQRFSVSCILIYQ